MKHTWGVTAILLVMFVITQLIGLAVINAYTPVKIIDGVSQEKPSPQVPYGMEPPKDIQPEISILTIVTAFIIAIVLIALLSKIKAKLFLRTWFFIVIILAIGITLNSIFFKFNLPYPSAIAALVALPLAFYKIFRQNLIVHNITELLIYPGIAVVFVPILNIWTIIILLLLISIYDIYAVWHSGFMQKMARFQINHLKFFAGFFVPYLGKKQRKQVREIKQKYKSKKRMEAALKKKKIKISLAILGGGDVIFPIIASGIFLQKFGFNTINIFNFSLLLPVASLILTFFATTALVGLFVLAKKGKFYPAMPFISAGIFAGMLVAKLVV